MGAEPVRLHIVATGFGSFRGVEDNPTSYIVTRLKDYLAGRGKSLPGHAEAVFEVLTVAGMEVDVWLTETADKLSGALPDGSEVLWVHFGVDVHATHFKLEARAKNEASFRTPDQGGWQPKQQPIDADEPLDSYLYTDLPLASIAASLASGPLVTISGDGGLFVCNYTYYASLRQAQGQAAERWHSLFVHVPPFEVIPADTQLRFAANLLDVLAAELAPMPAAPLKLQPSLVSATA